MFRLPAPHEVAHCAEFHSFVALQVLDEAFEHQHTVPASDHLWVHGENEHALAHLGVEILKVSSPNVIYASRVRQSLTDAVTARRILKKGKVVQVPGKGHFYQINGFAEFIGRINRRLDAAAAVIGSKVIG